MDELNEPGTEVFSHHGVILRNPNIRDDDSYCNGTLSIVQYRFGKCIEWKPIEVSEVSDCQEQDWSLVTTVGHRPRTVSTNSVGSCDGHMKMQPVRVELSDLKSYKVKKHGRYLILMQKDGTSHNAFYFQYDNADCFVNAMRAIVRTRRSARDRNLFIVVEERNELESLNQSFAELNLFPGSENPTDVVWKFVSNLKHRPYETTMETFSKLTDVFLYKEPEQRPSAEVADLLIRSLSSAEMPRELAAEAEEDYQMVPSLPPRPVLQRGAPLSEKQWTGILDSQGAVTDPELIKSIIFRGGITPPLRHVVWKYLLGYYPWHSRTLEQQELRKQKVEEYFRMKLQWRSMSLAQEERFSDFRDRKSLIEKDVNRTDRTHPFFEGENNANVTLLYDILMTYVMYNFDLGYVQGMSDLLSPILILLSNEVDAFWCFVGLMDRVFRNFDMDQAGMKKQLSQLHTLLAAIEPELSVYLDQHDSGNMNFDMDQAGMKKQLSQLHTLLAAIEPELSVYLDQHDSGNMFFCFRWLLVLFKREFSHDDILPLWESIFSDLPCPNFHLLLCVAILDSEKDILIENKYEFNEILKHVNDLSMKIDLDDIICRAEAIYIQLRATPDLPVSVKKIIGLAPSNSTNGSSDDEEDMSQHDCETVNIADADCT